MRAMLIASAILSASPVFAACEFVEGGCSRDAYGNSYRTEENFSGGYTTYRDGTPYSSTHQNSYGNWDVRSRDGGLIHRYDADPYASDY